MIIKVCGMRDSLNIKLVEQLNVDWMGFIFYPKSSRFVSNIPSYLPTKQKRVGVFVNADLNFILKHATDYNLDFIQLHGNETPSFCREIKSTGLSVIKAFGISESTNFTAISTYENCADYFLFDTHSTTVGGSGKTFDHSLLFQYNGKTPFLLSGGLGLENLNDIVHFYHPSLLGLDLNSCFEFSPGIKSVSCLQSFITNYKQKINQTK